MPYTSPIVLLQELGYDDLVSTGEVPDFGQLRKRMLLEWELAEDITVTLGGRAYTRQDVFDLVEGWRRAEADWSYHWQLARFPGLLRFVEGAQTGPSYHLPAPMAVLKGEERERMITFLGTHMRPVLVTTIRKAFAQRQFKALLELVPWLDTLDLQSQDDFQLMIIRQVNRLMLQIRQVTASPGKLPKRAWLFLREPSTYQFLNQTGPGLQYLRTQLGIAVNDLIYTKHPIQKNFIAQIADALVLLDCEEEVARMLDRNRKMLVQNLVRKKDLQEAIRVGLYMLGIIVIIIVLARLLHPA